LLATATRRSNCGLFAASHSSASLLIKGDDPPFLLIAYSQPDHVLPGNLICSISVFTAGFAAINSLFPTDP
jgi:hypothetical protein